MKKPIARPLLVATAGLAMLSVGCKKPMVTGNLMAPVCVKDGGVCVDDVPTPPPEPPKPADAGS
ncbi:MAG: hypothetical protein GQE15_14170 [Archangiaceae bacterium]|nr:hypothetical protein [Archangiaceae bacterium]